MLEKPTEKERKEAEARSRARFGKHVYTPVEYCMNFSDYVDNRDCSISVNMSRGIDQLRQMRRER